MKDEAGLPLMLLVPRGSVDRRCMGAAACSARTAWVGALPMPPLLLQACCWLVAVAAAPIRANSTPKTARCMSEPNFRGCY